MRPGSNKPASEMRERERGEQDDEGEEAEEEATGDDNEG
jgi:hypothetical protein